jgi:hypothetical protein
MTFEIPAINQNSICLPRIYFINENYEITLDEKDKIKSSDLLLNYNNYNDFKIDAKKLKQMMDYNRFKYRRFTDGVYYTNLKIKQVATIEPSDFI